MQPISKVYRLASGTGEAIRFMVVRHSIFGLRAGKHKYLDLVVMPQRTHIYDSVTSIDTFYDSAVMCRQRLVSAIQMKLRE